MGENKFFKFSKEKNQSDSIGRETKKKIKSKTCTRREVLQLSLDKQMAIRRDDLPTNFQWAFKRRRRKCPLSFMRVLVYRLPLISFLTKQHGRPAANRPHWEKTSQTPPTFPFLRVAIYISDTCCHWKSFRLEPKRKKKLPPNYLNECKFVCLFLSENKNNQFYFSD